jgi:hypothetical protein
MSQFNAICSPVTAGQQRGTDIVIRTIIKFEVC